MINSNDYLKQMSDFQANFFRPVTRYHEIAAKLTEELTSNSIRTMNKILEDYQNGFKALADIKKWEDLLAVQTALTDKTTNDILESNQKCSEIMGAAMQDMSKLMQENYEKVAAAVPPQMKQAAAPFAKAAQNLKDIAEGKGGKHS